MTASAHTLESRLFRSYFDDGLLDVLAGAGILGIAGFWALDLIAIGALVPALLATFWAPLRRSLVEPRFGLVEFSAARTERLRQLGRGSVALGTGMFLACAVVWVLGRGDAGMFVSTFAPAIPAGLLGLMAIVGGWGLELPRLLGYAAVFVVAGLGVALADARPEIAMLAGGAVTLASGGWRLSRFLRLPIEREDD